MGARIAAAIILLAGCSGATLDGSTTEVTPARDGPPIDAAIDAPVDARPCAGGDARATDAAGSCFVFFMAPVTYVNAETACMMFGSKLAVIKNVATNTIVTSLVGQADAFIGGTDSAVEGNWIWLRNPLDPITVYTNWRTGEPNNGGTNPAGEDCMIIEGARMGTWDDRSCAPPPVGAGAYAYVCQF